MKGITNAITQSGSGGGGDIVYAVNNTGSEIVANQKVWLNKHNLDENEAYQYKPSQLSTQYLAVFDNDDNFLLYNCLSTSQDYNVTYNPDLKTWSEEALEKKTAAVNNPSFMRFVNNEVIVYTNKYVNNDTTIFSGLVNKDRNTGYTGLYLGGGYRVKYSSNSVFVLEYPGEYGGSQTKEISGFGGYLATAIILDNRLFIADYKGNYKICTTTGDVIKEKTNALFSTSYPIQFFTGLNPGDYVLLNTGKNQSSYEASPLAIYQFDSDHNLIEPTDLPEDLRVLIGQNAFIQYYNNLNILTVGTIDNVYMFKFDGTKFVNMNITIQLPTDSKIDTSSSYRLFFSQDMTSAVISYKRDTSSLIYYACGFYKLKTASEDWYADTFPQFSANTLTGKATGNTDEQGRYEVKTVLGE